MQNPFRKDDAVLTRVKGAVVEASITQTWNNEVQVKTTMGDVLWRTIYTVWRAGEAPLQREWATLPASTSEQNDQTQPRQTKRLARRTKRAASKSKSRKGK